MSELSIGLQTAGTHLESFGHTLVGRFGALNVLTAALLGGALVLDRVLSRRVRASWRIALFAPVVLRVFLPLDWSLRVAHAPSVVTLFAPLSVTGSSSVVEGAASPALSWYALAAVAYVAVAAMLAVRAVLARVRLGRALASAQPLAMPARHGDVPCPVLQHEDLGPMAVGILAPRIVLPKRLLAAGEENALGCVLRHESAHLRRGDAWLSGAMQILAIVAWPVVPVWIAIARVRQLVELACDEAALAGADATERRRYGHALLDIAEWRSLVVAPLGAGELHFGSTLRARIEALASQSHWPVAAQGVTLSVASVALLVACAGSAPPVATTGGAASASDGDTGYGYAFDTDTPKIAAAAPASPAPVLNGDGRVSPEVIQSTVRAHFGAFKSCYDAGLKKNSKLAGMVTVKTVVGMDGVPTEAADSHSTLPDADVVACVAGEFRKMAFPKGPGVLTLEYPIQLTPP
jgi:beta-lactamase regulating signal transducer with metallopeptidase domain